MVSNDEGLWRRFAYQQERQGAMYYKIRATPS